MTTRLICSTRELPEFKTCIVGVQTIFRILNGDDSFYNGTFRLRKCFHEGFCTIYDLHLRGKQIEHGPHPDMNPLVRAIDVLHVLTTGKRTRFICSTVYDQIMPYHRAIKKN